MLRLENVVKEYIVGDSKVVALKGISISFRKNEFVSILGPSGCGKTTTLNIIGGLDKYTSGDLFINGISTKEFKDRDWDVYRNHRVGFIFQSYNLIPHQTILGNVELALTIAGISKEERIERAKKALDEVGLSGQYYKRPNQLSGGQCQRVAIARALVNNPEILLADEPTGALDTVTSVQIMELIKKISEDRLVIMVTHNPELADKYSTRIIKMLDGELQEDSNPYSEEEEKNEVFEVIDANVKEKAKMSFWTAFKLSARNLYSKLKRTVMVALAGCIGIVGVSTVLAVSRGVNDYIDDLQNDMISGYPISIGESGIDYATLMDSSSFEQKREALKKGDWVNVNSMIEYLATHSDVLSSLVYNNNIDEKYIQYIKDMPSDYYSSITFDYGLELSNNVYTTFKRDNSSEEKTMSIAAIRTLYTAVLETMEDYKEYASIISGISKPFSQGVSSNDYILSQYEIVSGKMPSEYNEIMVVLDDEEAMYDLTLAQLGYYTEEEFFDLVYKVSDDPRYTDENYKKKFEYDEILNKKIVMYNNDLIYNENTSWSDGTNYKEQSPFTYNPYADASWQGTELKIVGIIKPKKGVNYGSLSSGIVYNESLALKYIKDNGDSKIANFIRSMGGTIQTAAITTIEYNGEKTQVNTTIPYTIDFDYKKAGESTYTHDTYKSFVGETNQSVQMMSFFSGKKSDVKTMDSRYVGGEDLPETIKIYSTDFSVKKKVINYLDKWNDESVVIKLSTGEEIQPAFRDNIKYEDTVGLIMNMINSMVDLVTIALVAFTALSLVVSTVMVGIITYVSVVERVKEIGVIRSLGGRKKDVSHLFNAETFIIGLSSGVIGIIITALLSLVLNLIVKHFAGFNIAHLTFGVSVVMIILSVILTSISGIIPARAAAKQDPVNALRSE